jgi:hypothetical protein
VCFQGVKSAAETNDMCVGTGESLVFTSTELSDQSAQCHVSLDLHSQPSEAEPSEAEPSETDSTSFYLRFKERTDLHRSNGWDITG